MTRDCMGYMGLSASFQLCSAMIERFGLSLFPSPDDDSSKFYCVEFLSKLGDSENLKSAIFQAEILPNDLGLSWASHMNASSLEQRSDSEKDEYVQAGYLTVEKFYQEIGKVEDLEVLKGFDRQVLEAIDQTNRLDAEISRHCDNRFGIGSIVESLTKMHRWYRGIVQDQWEILERGRRRRSRSRVMIRNQIIRVREGARAK